MIEIFGFAKIWCNGELQEEDISHKDVISIHYNEPRGEGDAHFVDTLYSDGTSKRVFRPDEIVFLQRKNKMEVE